MELEELIKGCKRYNIKAQKLLYERYANKMYKICLRYLSNPEDAKDILQDSFIKIFSNIHQYNGTGAFEGWMTRIFINTSLKFLNKTKNINTQNNIEQLENLNNDNSNNEYIIDEINEIENELETNNNNFSKLDFTQQEIFDAISMIPEKYRVVFYMFHVDELDHDEIAKELVIDAGTSRIRLFRARKLIREEMDKLTQLKKLNTIASHA